MALHKATNTHGAVIASATTRAYLYAIGVAAAPVAVTYGLVNETQAGLWLALGGAILGVTNTLALVNTRNVK